MHRLARALMPRERRFSALQRAEIAEIERVIDITACAARVSVLFNEPKLLKFVYPHQRRYHCYVSVLFNEPKLLKSLSGIEDS